MSENSASNGMSNIARKATVDVCYTVVYFISVWNLYYVSIESKEAVRDVFVRISLTESLCPNLFVRISLSESLCPNLFVRISLSESLCPNLFVRISLSESLCPNQFRLKYLSETLVECQVSKTKDLRDVWCQSWTVRNMFVRNIYMSIFLC